MQSYSGNKSNEQPAPVPASFPQPSTPWLLDGMPWVLATTNAPPGVMQFGSTPAEFNQKTESHCKLQHHKRKALRQHASLLPPKQLITEDRITMHFSGLQISNDSNGGLATGAANGAVSNGSLTSLASDDIPSTSKGKTHHQSHSSNPAYQIAAMELGQKLRNANRIVICDELKLKQPGTVNNTTNIPAELLLSSIPRPCTALIPWQPPQNVAKIFGMADLTPQQKHQQQQPHGLAAANAVDLEDYDDDLGFFENNNTCNVNFNKADVEMDEDLDL